MVVSRRFRNQGYSYGLEYPYIFGRLPPRERWSVWHRHTGRVIFQSRDPNDALARLAAMKRCEKLNGNPLPVVLW